MTIELLAIAVLSAAGIAATVVAVVRDGYGQLPNRRA